MDVYNGLDYALRKKRGGIAVGNPYRWGDTFDGLEILVDEIEEKGLARVLEEADERGLEGRDIRKLFKSLRNRHLRALTCPPVLHIAE